MNAQDIVNPVRGARVSYCGIGTPHWVPSGRPKLTTNAQETFQPQFFTLHSPQRACHSGTVLRISLLSDFHIQRYCQWYGCSMAYFDKGRRGFGNSSKCREKFGASLCFSSANFPANIVSVHFVWRFTANFVSVRGTETGGAQRRAASAKQLHFSSPHWSLVNNGGFLGNEAVNR